MLVAAAVCPPTPLIVLGLTDLRSACRAAIAALAAVRPDVLLVVGGAETAGTYDGRAAGTLRPWGLDVTAGHGEPVLPLSPDRRPGPARGPRPGRVPVGGF